jgi:hypothetical protein
VGESTYFQLLSEVCENAEIYESASAEMALAPRSQLIDKILVLNELDPQMFMLSREQQLVVGNQFTKLLMNRLKTWGRLGTLLDGRIQLKELPEEEQITAIEWAAVFSTESV